MELEFCLFWYLLEAHTNQRTHTTIAVVVPTVQWWWGLWYRASPKKAGARPP